MVKMETDTLSSYENGQDKHILDDSMEINIPRNDERSDTHQTKEYNSVNPELRLKDSISDNTEERKLNCESSENKENENDSDPHITNDESYLNNEVVSEKDLGTDEEKEDNEKEKSEEGCSGDSGSKEDEDTTNMVDTDSHHEEEKEPLNNENNDPLSVEEVVDDNSDIPDTEEKDPLNDSDYQKEDPLDDRNSLENTSSEKTRKDTNSPVISEGDNKGEDVTSKDNDQSANVEKEIDSNIVEDENETSPNIIEEEKIDDSEKEEDKNKDCPLLKETLTKPRPEDDDQQKEAEGMEDIDMDDDFDPSLLCPDIAMEVDEAPVITNSELPPVDGNKSPLLYEPMFSTYVDEMTGAEVSFNLSAEEQKLRQERFEDNPVQFTKVHCTACNVHLGSALDGQSNRFVHPLLKVLICKDCYHFYTSGEFEKDEDGSELYCRWCGQGGQVICCSSCEMVFCKKCIRINFGRKKLTEIRDSDEWLCFRCNPAQLTPLRVHCAEFMEYVRREISRAATLENATSFMTTDYTQCCLSQKKKYVDPHPSEPKRKRRKTSINDPDYDPMKDRSLSPQPSTSGLPPATPAGSEATSQKLVPILPKPSDPNQKPGIVTQATPNNNVFRVGNTTFRPRASQFSQPRPRVQVINPTSTPPVRPQSSGPGYIKILPGGIRVPPSPTRNQSPQNFNRQPFQHRPMRSPVNNSNQMKHEWFEKTVRAAARVNSNLSYTLTQLNRAQATATSVEALAVVHNKLQEILSTSINSLIQIRKNLRTEFIAGIKNIRFPPKPQPQPSTSTQDDDVIFVSPTPSPVPPPLLQSTSASTASPITSINLPPSVSLTKRTSTTSNSSPRPSTSNDNDKPKVFLRVKSLTALQNVPSECITIPDDPIPSSPPPLAPIQKIPEISIIENNPEKKDEKQDKDTTSTEEPVRIEENHTNGDKPKKENHMENAEISAENTNGDKNEDREEGLEIKKEPIEPLEENGSSKKNQHNRKNLAHLFDAKTTSSSELKKIFNVKIHITRSEEIDKMVQQKFGLVNGDASE